MNSKQKKRVKTLGVVIVEGDDRISALPDHVLCQILTLLPTKCAAQTSVLSKRWKDLFASIPIIDCDALPQRGTAANRSFVDFIYRLLYLIGLRHSHIRKFRISVSRIPPVGRTIISSWISSAVSFNVHELIFCLGRDASVLLPLSLFSCKSLTVLKLEGKFLLTLPNNVSLPSLNTLWLTRALLKDDDSVRRLLLGCPVLEDLAFDSCNMENIKVFDMSCTSTKRLSIDCRGDYELIFTAPNLEQLKVTSYVETKCTGDALNSLLEASIRLELWPDGDVSQAKILEVVNIACNAQKLFLRGDTMEGLVYAMHSLPIFHALTHLKLSVKYNEGWKLLPALLDRSPCLETLILVGFRNKDKQFPLPHVPICFSMHLKTIQLNYFQAKEEEFTMVEYILGEAKILENMTIYGIQPNIGHFQVVSERLLAFSTYSKTCRIFLGDYEGRKAYQIM